MGKTVLYSKEVVEGTGIIGFVAKKAFNTSLTIDDMVNGKSIDCKDIVEMLAIEEQIRQASKVFADVLRAAAHFGGEELIDLSAEPVAA
jgi:F420-0:gamma-glutamyl ligase-like protein